MYSWVKGPAKSVVKHKYPRAKDIRVGHSSNCIEIWSEGVQEGFLLAVGRDRVEAWFKAAKAVENEQ